MQKECTLNSLNAKNPVKYQSLRLREVPELPLPRLVELPLLLTDPLLPLLDPDEPTDPELRVVLVVDLVTEPVLRVVFVVDLVTDPVLRVVVVAGEDRCTPDAGDRVVVAARSVRTDEAPERSVLATAVVLLVTVEGAARLTLRVVAVLLFTLLRDASLAMKSVERVAVTLPDPRTVRVLCGETPVTFW
ncbi:hypothetical protein QA596_11145 [Balneolales bacterium ANBcel1]|nr:hypothetical protein [Balneolales bacterium ANBcel1]